MAQLSPSLFSYIVTYKEYSLGFEIRSFLADSDIRIESLIADSALKSIAVFSTNPPPPPSNGFQQLIGVGLKMLPATNQGRLENGSPHLSGLVLKYNNIKAITQ